MAYIIVSKPNFINTFLATVFPAFYIDYFVCFIVGNCTYLSYLDKTKLVIMLYFPNVPKVYVPDVYIYLWMADVLPHKAFCLQISSRYSIKKGMGITSLNQTATVTTTT